MYFEIIINTSCNWNCYYCAFAKYKRNKIITYNTLEKYRWIFNIINKTYSKNDIILIEGGEIGLIDDVNLLYKLFSKFPKKSITIDTNGKFLEKNYHEHPKLKPYIKEIYYHLIEDPKNLVKVKKYEADIPIINGIVGEPEYLYDFIKYNNHVFFHYVDVETKNPNFKYEEHLNDFKKLLDLSNVNKEKIYEILNRKTIEIKKNQKICPHLNSYLVINLAEEKLNLCSTKGNHIKINLNKNNFLNIIFKENIFKKENEFCKNCFRLSINKKSLYKNKFLKGLLKNELGKN